MSRTDKKDVKELKISVFSRLKDLFCGTRYHCPFCNRSSSRFLPAGLEFDVIVKKKIIGAGRRPNAICPYCSSLDRERKLFLFLEKNKLIVPHMRLLHIAPEQNIKKKLSMKNIDYITADLGDSCADLKMDIQRIQFPSGDFDAIICSHVLEHVKDDKKAMKELYRVLKPGGWAILQVPISMTMKKTLEDPSVKTPSERERIFGQSDHVRIYGPDYILRLNSAGFSVELDRLDDSVNKRYSLIPEETIFFCRK